MVTPMRRRVSTVMTVLTAVVIGLSVRASALGHGAGGPADPVALVPAGVVAAPRTTTPSAAPRAKQSRPPRSPRASSSPSASPSNVTVDGAVVDTRYGPVQVQVTVRGARIVTAHAIDYPNGGGRDQEINSRAIPQLDQETLQTQSARIDTVSGATYTSDGYRRSLQSALDAAHRSA